MEKALFDAIGTKQSSVTFTSNVDQEEKLLDLRYKFWREKRTVLTWAVDRPVDLVSADIMDAHAHLEMAQLAQAAREKAKAQIANWKTDDLPQDPEEALAVSMKRADARATEHGIKSYTPEEFARDSKEDVYNGGNNLVEVAGQRTYYISIQYP
jgi:hypothetical protein